MGHRKTLDAISNCYPDFFFSSEPKYRLFSGRGHFFARQCMLATYFFRQKIFWAVRITEADSLLFDSWCHIARAENAHDIMK